MKILPSTIGYYDGSGTWHVEQQVSPKRLLQVKAQYGDPAVLAQSTGDTPSLFWFDSGSPQLPVNATVVTTPVADADVPPAPPFDAGAQAQGAPVPAPAAAPDAAPAAAPPAPPAPPKTSRTKWIVGGLAGLAVVVSGGWWWRRHSQTLRRLSER